MEENIISSGRANYLIDPVLNIWHWEIPVYLFLGGMAAGILFFASLQYLRGKADLYPSAVKYAPLFAPFMLAIGLFALMLDLKHPLYSWQLYTTFRIESPMSWGAWTLMLVTPLSFMWAFSYVREVFPKIKYPIKFLYTVEAWMRNIRTPMAWILVGFSIITGVYTGILLSAFNARPLWNTTILGPLFLSSGLSAGAAFILLLAKKKKEIHLFTEIDLMLIVIEIFLIIHMVMGYQAGTANQIEASKILLGGEYTISFWVFAFAIGLVLPMILKILELRGKKIPLIVPSLLVIFGSLMLRLVITYAGQIT